MSQNNKIQYTPYITQGVTNIPIVKMANPKVIYTEPQQKIEELSFEEPIEEPIEEQSASIVMPKQQVTPIVVSLNQRSAIKTRDIGNMQPVLDQLEKAGIKVRVTSGKRAAGEAGDAGSKSHHVHGNAIDIVPGEGETWDTMIAKIKSNNELKQ